MRASRRLEGANVQTCKTCGVALDVTLSHCPSCQEEVPFGRLTNVLGLVCRHCDAYNDPGARVCLACQKPLGAVAAPAGAVARASASSRPALPAQPDPARKPTPARARLIVDRGAVAPGAEIAVGPEEVQVGRAHGQLLVLDDPCLAPLHASFVVRGTALFVRDEGAAGGVFVRLRGLTVPLRPGAVFAVGDCLLRFGGPLPPPPPPIPDGTRRLGSPRPDQPTVTLDEWLEGGLPGRSYLRSGTSISIGRAGCAVNLGSDPHLAQTHAELLLDPDGGARLRDLGSESGTFLRMAPGSERPLHDGDAVRLGREVLRVELG
ncbi:MAG TPA: FHA domain-containing protein [Anaeromyxobacteraceae bacterium]|nr:FHA domain-containing protein [Anaeromyxobacteraceae bacterium]